MSEQRSLADEVTGVVLAGGGVTRFGSDKLRAELRGKSLLHHPIEALATVCTRIIVVTHHGAADPPLPEVDAELVVARDRVSGGGPVVGVASGLDLVWTPVSLVAGGDMPDLATGVLEGLARVALGRPESVAVVLEHEGTFSPLPCAVQTVGFRQAANDFLTTGGTQLKDLLTIVPSERIPEQEWKRLDPTGTTVHDVDHPEAFPPG